MRKVTYLSLEEKDWERLEELRIRLDVNRSRAMVIAVNFLYALMVKEKPSEILVGNKVSTEFERILRLDSVINHKEKLGGDEHG